MEPEAVPESPRPRMRLQRLATELQRDWGVTLRIFDDYRELPPHRRYRALGQLFERLCPWIERGIQSTVLSHFVLIPTEQALSRLFSRTTEKEHLPRSYLLYLHWIESSLMRAFKLDSDRFAAQQQTPGDPSTALCERFNKLALFERSLLYLYVVERCTPTEVSENSGIPYPDVLEAVPALWKNLRNSIPEDKLPSGWQIPEADQDGLLVVRRTE